MRVRREGARCLEGGGRRCEGCILRGVRVGEWWGEKDVEVRGEGGKDVEVSGGVGRMWR